MSQSTRSESVQGPTGRAARPANKPVRFDRAGRFQAQMKEIVDLARGIDIRKYETLSADRALVELYPATLRLVEQAKALVTDVIAACVDPNQVDAIAKRAGPSLSPPFLPFERAVDAAVEGAAPSLQAVEDIAFMVQLELRQRHERLERIARVSDILTVLGECDSSLRRIPKGFGAIDLAIARAEGLTPVIDFSSECEDSLQVRGAYSKFRARITAGGEPTPAELYGRMRAVGTHIAVMIGWEAYPLLRVRDRLQLRALQRRILHWLLPENRSDSLEGLRLWQDLAAFIGMLAQVNRRQELVEHDARMLGEALNALGACGHETSDIVLEQLGRLEGLDDELDRLLAAAPRPSARAFRQVLDRLCARIGAVTWGER